MGGMTPHLTHLTLWLQTLNAWVWGLPLIVLILGTGLYLQLRLRFMPLRQIGPSLRLIWRSRQVNDAGAGQISPYAALMTALSATIGTGNIVGVATAIAVGGPGALFWMWMTALVGMATKYAEVVLAVHYRQPDGQGGWSGGPMHAIEQGLGPRWRPLAVAFALCGGVAGFGGGNMVQANGIASALQHAFGWPSWATGVGLLVLTGAVVLGGIRRIGAVAEKLVPAMCLGYMACVAVVLIRYADQILPAFGLIVQTAFTGTAATGGFVGASLMLAVQRGVSRGIFSNEAGLGTAGIAQAAGATHDPVYSGLIGMMGTFIDTLVVCTLTGLAIVVSGAWTDGSTGAVLTATSFDAALPGLGPALVALSLTVFAFTTILGWAYYGERCWAYLLGPGCITPYRWVWTLAVWPGAVLSLDLAWLVADTLNALMAVPNLVSLLVLCPVVLRLSEDYFRSARAGA